MLYDFTQIQNSIQWNLSKTDTIGTEESVLIREVSSFQKLKCMQERDLGQENVSCLERVSIFQRCPFREVPLYPKIHI